MTDDDGDLLEAWRTGDLRAGDTLLRRHFDTVHRFYASKLGPDVQDLIQKTFAACVESRDRIVGAGFRSYLLGIARHRLIDELRRRGAAPSFDPAGSSLAETGITPSRALDARREVRLLRRALASLPLDLQITIELFYWEAMPTAEIAAATGVAEHTARSRLARARERLRDEIRRLADSPEDAESTLGDLESWARRIRDAIL